MNDLVVVSLEAWDDVWRRNQHLVSRLLASDPGLRVLFVEPPADPVHDLRRGARWQRARGLRPAKLAGASDRLWLFQPTKWLPRNFGPAADRLLAAAVARAARRLRMTRPVLWLNDPMAVEVLRRTGWRALYDITDDWLLAERSPREHARLTTNEAYLLEHCEHVVVCSPRLLETKRAERVTLIQNAVDLDAYRGDLRRPVDLPAGKVVLYVGTLHRDRLDVELCERLATTLGLEATLTMVGPVALDAEDERRLTASGAVVLGAREHTAVPAYLRSADVLVVPHTVTGFTDSLDPIKVYEYLAAGRPVVSTPVAGFRDLTVAQVHIARRDEFAASVVGALASGSEHPGPTAEVPTGDDRASAMREVLDELRGRVR